MSADNRFERNVFAGNLVGFMVGADRAANCAKPGFAPNRSRDDHFTGPREDDRAASYGRCIVFAGDGS